MVGTLGFTKSHGLHGKSESTLDHQRESLIRNDPAQELNENGHVILMNKDQDSKKGHTSLQRCYFALILIVFILASFAFICAIINMTFVDSTIKPTVLVYDGSRKTVSWPPPPPHDKHAAVARYVLHISEWGSLSTNSTHKGIEGYPFVNVFSVSDGPLDNSTGVPYFYLTPMELSVKDIKVDAKVSFTVSEAQSDYCNRKGFDPEDPRCAHIIFSGTMKKIEKGSDEEVFARYALFSRHSEMKDWPIGHAWFFAKLDIVHIYVLDFFGGVAVVTPEEYFAASPF